MRKAYPDPGTLAGLLVVLAVAIVVFLLALGMRAHAAWVNIAGEWDQYRLNESQRAWFKTVRAKNGVPCCDVADGHPTAMEHCGDGTPNRELKPGERNVCENNRGDAYYVPDPRDPKSDWLKVPDDAMTKPPNNPIGVATVWYVLYPPGTNPEVYIRCFVPENES